MKNKIKQLRKNKFFNILVIFIEIILTVLVLGILAVILVQRVTNDKVHLGNYSIYTISSGSMMPIYEVSDVILAKSVDQDDISIGDNIVYYGEEGEVKDKTITHKVISIDDTKEEYTYITKGVANLANDPEITYSQVKGKVIYKFKTLSFCSHIINNPYGFYFLIFIPFVIFAFFEVLDIKKEIDAEKLK